MWVPCVQPWHVVWYVLQEVIVVEDENGQIVRETMKDNDVLTQYKNMRETLVYLSNLDHDDTERQMLERLRAQMAGQWTWNGLNTLCWAIGSISGSMAVRMCALCRTGGLQSICCSCALPGFLVCSNSGSTAVRTCYCCTPC